MNKPYNSFIQNLSISYECSLAIGNSLNLEEMLHEVIHTIVHKTNAHRGTIWLCKGKDKNEIRIGARAGSLLTEAEIKKRVGSFKSIFEKIWKNKRPVIKNRGDKDFFQYCFKITGKEQSVLIVPVKNVAIIKLVYTNREIVNETLANILLSLSEKLGLAIKACLSHENIKIEIQVRQETEKFLKDSEQKYRTTIDYIGKAVHVVDKNLNIVLFNKTFKQWNKELGLETENLIGRNIFDIFPFLSDTVHDEYQKVFKTAKVLISVETNEFAGKAITTETRKIPILENNKVVRVVTVVDDITEQKKAEDVLKKREQFFSGTLNDMLTFVAVLEPDGKVIFVNNTPLDAAGIKLEDVIGKRLYDAYWFRYSEKAKQTIKGDITACVSGKTLIREIELQVAGGELIWIEFSLHPIYNEEGKVKYLVPEGRDITGRKRAENELKESEKKYHTFFKTSRDCVFITSKDGRFIDINDAGVKFFGYENKDDLMRHKVPEIYENPEERKGHTQLIEQQGFSKDFAINLRKRDGSIINSLVTTAVKKDVNGNVIGYQGTIRDITERKKAEDELKKKTERIISDKEKIEKLYKDSEGSRKSLLSILEDVAEKEKALRESEERFQDVVTNTGDWIWEIDEKGCFTYCSPIVKQVLGYEYKEMIGKYFYEFSSPDDREQLGKTAFKRSKKKEKIKNMVSQNIHKDGHTVFLETNAVPLFDDKGNLLRGYRGVTRDITERKQAEEALRQSEENFKNIFQSVPESLLAVNKQIKVLKSNNAFAKLIIKYAPELNMSEDELKQIILSELRKQSRKTKHGIIEISAVAGRKSL